MKAVLIVSHGSHNPETKKEILALVHTLRERLKGSLVEYAFLEIEEPGIAQAIDHCVSKGATSILVALNFLNTGRHVHQDIPSIVLSAQKRHPSIKLALSKPVGQHPKIPDLFLDLINNAAL